MVRRHRRPRQLLLQRVQRNIRPRDDQLGRIYGSLRITRHGQDYVIQFRGLGPRSRPMFRIIELPVVNRVFGRVIRPGRAYNMFYWYWHEFVREFDTLLARHIWSIFE